MRQHLTKDLATATIQCVHAGNLDAASLLLDEKTEIERLQQFELAYKEWMRLTEWVQERKDWPFSHLGKHRANVMRLYIEHLELKGPATP